MPEPSIQATETLLAQVSGDRRAASDLMPLVYDELRRQAARYMQKERPEHTLQPTALVHEAYLRLIDISRIDWKGKTHFFAVAATQMRRILVEHARAASADKRGGRRQQITLTESLLASHSISLDLLALDEALNRLEEGSPRQASTAVLRLFGGLSVKETALALDVSERTVNNDWRVARAWLRTELGPATGEGGSP